MLLDQVEAILKDLAKRDNLTDTEKQFKEDAENGIIIDITEKKNPQIYIWENKDGSLTKLISSRFRYSNDDYSNEQHHTNKEILDDNEELRTELNVYLELLNQVCVKGGAIKRKFRLPNVGSKNYNFNQKLDYAVNGSIESLTNQFGYYDGDDCVPTIL